MDNNNIMREILEKGGTISWQGRYFLDFIDAWNVNPDKEWSGYEISELTSWGHHKIYSSMKINEILEYFNILIDDAERDNFINGWKNK